MENLQEKITKIRSKMSENGVDYCILSNNDPNFSSNPDEYWKVLNWLFGFDDNGVLILGKEKGSYFFTDERYKLALEEKLKGTDVELKITTNAENTALGFACDVINNEKKGNPAILALDDKTMHFSSFLSIDMNKRPRVIFKPLDFINFVWDNRPKLQQYDIFDVENIVFPNTFDRIYTPRSAKIKGVLALFRDIEDEFALLFTSSNDICWLLNIRSYSCIPSMVPPCFFILTKETGYLFIQGKIDDKLKRDFNYIDSEDDSIRSIKVFEYEDFFTKAHFLIPHGASVLQTSDSSCATISTVFPAVDYKHIAINRDGIDNIKAVRSENEIKSIRIAFVEDSLSYIKFINNIEYMYNYIQNEYDACRKFDDIRKRCPYFISRSFDTIFAFKENGAKPHYKPEEYSAKKIEGSGLAVFDFGSQYDFGTTDTTRTLLFGSALPEFKYYYTAVLKSHLFLQICNFDIGIEGFRLDAMARGILIKYSIKVPHGIGHGVSMLADVHDSAPRLSYTVSPSSIFSIKPGMVFTVEPGVYLENKFGIRIENTVVARKVEGDETKMYFEPLSLCPYNIDLIDKTMLDKQEIEFINSYHKRIYDKLATRLNGSELAYLQRICRNI